MTLNRYHLHHLVKKKHKGALKTQELLKHPDRINSLILLGNNFVNILAAVLTTLVAIRIGGNQAIAPAVAILTIVVLIFSEVTPKAIGASKPEMLAFLSLWVYEPLLKVFYPFIGIVNFSSGIILRLFGIKAKNSGAISPRENGLNNFVARDIQGMPSRYQSLLLSLMDLESVSVENIMTHRNDIIGIDLEDPIEDIIHQLRNSPHTRLPVYKKNIDRVIGFLHLRTILYLLNQPDFDKHFITDNLIKPFFIPAGTSIHGQMQTFKSEKLRIGLVVDEYGDVLGLLSLDDLLQGIIGELIAEEPNIQLQKDGGFLVNGSVTVRELNRVMQWGLPTEGPKTLNGLIIEYMETIPESGANIQLHGHGLEIIKSDDKSVKLVKFKPK